MLLFCILESFLVFYENYIDFYFDLDKRNPHWKVKGDLI